MAQQVVEDLKNKLVTQYMEVRILLQRAKSAMARRKRRLREFPERVAYVKMVENDLVYASRRLEQLQRDFMDRNFCLIVEASLMYLWKRCRPSVKGHRYWQRCLSRRYVDFAIEFKDFLYNYQTLMLTLNIRDVQ